jgi:hypothetical protein
MSECPFGDVETAELTPERIELLEAIQAASRTLWPIIAKLADVEGDVRTGGRFCLLDANGDQLAVWQEGVPLGEKIPVYAGNARVKCQAVIWHNVLCSGEIADVDATPPIYDGGIKLCNGWVLAFSGLRAELDRVYCMLVAVVAENDLLTQGRLNAIFQRGPNEALVRVLYQEAFMGWFMQGMGKALEGETA